MSRVYLIEAAKRLPPSKKNPKGKTVSYYVLRWAGTNGSTQEESLGRTRKSGGKITKAEAENMRAAKQLALGTGKVKIDRPGRMTLASFVEYDMDIIKLDVKSSTLHEYGIASNHAKEAIGGDIQLTQISWRHVSAIKQRLADRNCSKATLRKTIITLRAMFNRALKQGLVNSNPFAEQRLPKVQSKQKRIYSKAEVKRMIEAAPDIWWESFITLAVTSGMRKAEILNLTWRDIDFTNETVTVSAKRAGTFKVADYEYPILNWSAKSHHERTIPIPSDTIALLRRLQLKAGGSQYVFLSLTRLKRLRFKLEADGSVPAKFDVINNMLRIFKTIQADGRAAIAESKDVPIEQVDWPIGCLHDMRRTYGTWMADKIPMHVLQKYMGHQDISTTSKYYLGVTSESADRARQAVSLTA